MSMQRVFEVARKMGLPVVVTDPAGREPFVLLPLDQFEAMMGEGEKLKKSLPVEQIQPKSEILQQLEVPVPEVDEIALEERFYVDSEEGKAGG